MLVLRVCGVDYETIIKDYMCSQRTMASWNQRGDLPLKAHLTTETILSVERHYMEQAIEHIRIKYGDVPEYLQSCAVTLEKQAMVKAILAGPEAGTLTGTDADTAHSNSSTGKIMSVAP